MMTGWLEDYEKLFHMMRKHVEYKDKVLSECIFLTHNHKRHLLNLKTAPEAEKTLWTPDNQETKISEYGGENIRYEYKLKREYIHQFKELHNSIIPWNKIRYIF